MKTVGLDEWKNESQTHLSWLEEILWRFIIRVLNTTVRFFTLSGRRPSVAETLNINVHMHSKCLYFLCVLFSVSSFGTKLSVTGWTPVQQEAGGGRRRWVCCRIHCVYIQYKRLSVSSASPRMLMFWPRTRVHTRCTACCYVPLICM